MGGHSVELSTGKFFNLDCVSPESITIDDISNHLANIVRFNGAMKCTQWYSVAEHSVRVARFLCDRGAHPNYVFAGLMHDAHEAYIGDLTTPLKNLFEYEAPGVYRNIVQRLDRAIAQRFNIDISHLWSPGVVEADLAMLTIEAWHLMPSGGEHVEWSRLPHVSERDKERYAPAFWEPTYARRMFMELYTTCTVDRHLANR